MRRKGHTVAALAAMWTLACTGTPTSLEVGQLEGRWEWLSASGGIAGWTITPASEGYSMELRFLTGWEAQLYRDGTLHGSSLFRLETGREGGSFPGREVVRFERPLLGAWEEMGIELREPRRLVLSDGCCDGYAYSFERIVAP